MNNERDFFVNDVECNVIEDEIVLAPETELFEEAKAIAQTTVAAEKFPFTLQYDANQKEFLLSMLETVGAVVEDDEEGNKLKTRMNMTQLAFIKRLDCVERVKTDEGINPFLAEEAVKLTPPQHEDEARDDEVQAVVTDIDPATLEAQTEMAINRTTDVELEAVAVAEMEQAGNDIAVASVNATARSSCCSCPTNVSMETAATISDESYISGYICCPGAEQWFKFVATRTGQYTICTTGNLDTIGTLYDCGGNQITRVDDYAPCGKINFRIICNLTEGNTYYVKVGIFGDDTGNYTLRVTERVFANYVNINKSTITLEKGVTYELPITPNYTYKGYNGAQRIPGLSVSINPSNANEQKIWWWEENGNVLDCICDRDDDGDLYFHVTAIGNGTTTLYAEDWNENGKSDECTVTVVTPYCGGDNYRDVTQHSMVLQSDGYYVCSKCGYRIKSPALQDKDILSTDDYVKMIATMHYYTHNVLLAEEYPLAAVWYNEEARNCKIVMDTIRSKPQYSALYEYQGANNRYLATETTDKLDSFVTKKNVNALTLGIYNGFYETIASLVIGYYCPQVSVLLDVLSLLEDSVDGQIDAISFGAFIAGQLEMDDIANALSYFSSASEIVNSNVSIGDPIICISFSPAARAEYIFDANYNIEKVIIDYLE